MGHDEIAEHGAEFASGTEGEGFRFICGPAGLRFRNQQHLCAMNSKPFVRTLSATADPSEDRQSLDAGAASGSATAIVAVSSFFTKMARKTPGGVPALSALTACVFLALVAAVAVLLPHSQKSGPYGPYARLQISLDSLETLDAAALPHGLDTTLPMVADMDGASADIAYFEGSSVVRGDAGPQARGAGYHRFSAFLPGEEGRGLVRFSRGRVSVITADGTVPIARLRQYSAHADESRDIMQTDMFSPPARRDDNLLPPSLYGEETDAQGLPNRWSKSPDALPGDILACSFASSKSAIMLRALVRGLSVPSPNANYGAQAGKYRSFASRYAEKYNLATALILAIMHTESNFNLFAVSRSQAVGLMQIVPDTAGNEVHRYLTGFHGQPSLDTLFTPEDNIRYGTAYLHLLGRRYFGDVLNSSSRQMCVIAAYNGGPGAVLRLFDAYDQGAAVARINSLSPEQVYAALTTEMPNLETRRYVEVVLGRMRDYGVN